MNLPDEVMREGSTGERRNGCVNDDGLSLGLSQSLLSSGGLVPAETVNPTRANRQGETDYYEVPHTATTPTLHHRSRACGDLSLSSPARYVRLAMSAMTHKTVNDGPGQDQQATANNDLLSCEHGTERTANCGDVVTYQQFRRNVI